MKQFCVCVKVMVCGLCGDEGMSYEGRVVMETSHFCLQEIRHICGYKADIALSPHASECSWYGRMMNLLSVGVLFYLSGLRKMNLLSVGVILYLSGLGSGKNYVLFHGNIGHFFLYILLLCTSGVSEWSKWGPLTRHSLSLHHGCLSTRAL